MVTLPLVLCDQIAHLSGQVQLDQVDIPPMRGCRLSHVSSATDSQ